MHFTWLGGCRPSKVIPAAPRARGFGGFQLSALRGSGAMFKAAVDWASSWLRGASPGEGSVIVRRCWSRGRGPFLPEPAVLPPLSPPAGLQASNAVPAALGKRKAPEDDAPAEQQAAEGGGDGDEGRGAKRLAAAGPATHAPGPTRPAAEQPTASGGTDAAQAAAGAKRKAAGREEIEPAASDASPPALPRAAVRPRWEAPAPAGGPTTSTATAPALAIGSPAPSPYRLLSPAKAGAASLQQLPGFQFSRSRRSSAASDVSTGASASGAAGGRHASSSSIVAAQPLHRRKLAAPPSRLGGEPGCAAACATPLGTAGDMHPGRQEGAVGRVCLRSRRMCPSAGSLTTLAHSSLQARPAAAACVPACCPLSPLSRPA